MFQRQLIIILLQEHNKRMHTFHILPWIENLTLDSIHINHKPHRDQLVRVMRVVDLDSVLLISQYEVLFVVGGVVGGFCVGECEMFDELWDAEIGVYLDGGSFFRLRGEHFGDDQFLHLAEFVRYDALFMNTRVVCILGIFDVDK